MDKISEVQDNDARSKIVLVQGWSGTRKSRLVREVLKEYRSKAIIVEGTFYPSLSNAIRRPYRPFLDAFNDLAVQIMETDNVEVYQTNVCAAVGSEAFRVVSLVHQFEKVLGDLDDF